VGNCHPSVYRWGRKERGLKNEKKGTGTALNRFLVRIIGNVPSDVFGSSHWMGREGRDGERKPWILSDGHSERQTLHRAGIATVHRYDKKKRGRD